MSSSLDGVSVFCLVYLLWNFVKQEFSAGFTLSFGFLGFNAFPLYWLLTFHVGKIAIFSCKGSQRCAYPDRNFEAGKEAGEIINITDHTSSMLRYYLWNLRGGFEVWLNGVYLLIPLFPLDYM